MFEIRPGGEIPIFRQLMREIRHAIATGRLEPGEGLPSVRHLSAELSINPSTVVRAYDELEREGVLEKRRGLGTFVAGVGGTLPVGERRKLLRDAAEDLMVEALRLDLEVEDAHAALDEAARRLVRRGVAQRGKRR